MPEKLYFASIRKPFTTESQRHGEIWGAFSPYLPFSVSLCLCGEKSLEVAPSRPKPHNRPVATTAWQQRIRRAEHLAAQHPFAAEILGFYLHLARFQESLYQRLERSSVGSNAGVPPAVLRVEARAARPLPGQQDAAATNPELRASFPAFLFLVEDKAPAFLAQVARDLHNSPSDSWSELLNHCWSATGDPPADPQEFLACAFLQPYAELTRSRTPMQLGAYTYSLCPFCNRKPVLGILRPQGDGGRRSLLCGFCLAEWEFRRIVCPGCGQEDHAKLPVYTAEGFPYIRVECCDICQTYIKSIDLTKNGLAVPLVDELASVPLNLWAQERGYAKLHPNLFGM
jgi:FdhE protein